QNRLTKITYPDGKITEYTYDAAGNRTAVTNTVGDLIRDCHLRVR
ncbi:MAG: hypothetical protein PWQ91_1518, partial [Eubacteriales bacterium]|nr:hypothetical protein [Eubacteriales bacterium]